MAEFTRSVTSPKKKSNNQRVPDQLREYVVLAEWLSSSSFFERVDEELRVKRRGGAGTAGMAAFLLAFFVARAEGGLRGFWTSFRKSSVVLGGMAGLRKLPSSTALSRFLQTSIDMAAVSSFGAWLLGDALDARPIVHHPGASVVDGVGERWHFLDFDPSITAFRQRALPEGEDLPDPERLSETYAAPGYPGRKRADVQHARGLLQHAGTALWLHCSIGPGNGRPCEDFDGAVEAARRWKERMGVENCVMRFDGGIGGHLSNVEKCRTAGLNFVTRLSRYELLESDFIQALIKESTWRPVRDSGSGPRREAINIGFLYEGPDQSRLILSRFVAEGEKSRGAGCVRDGYQYEMFVTQLADGWSAPEIVTAYYGRCGQENRFLQEDKELGLDRLFSETLAGQLFVVLIGLFLWNVRTIRTASHLIDPDEMREDAVPMKQSSEQLAAEIPPVESPPIASEPSEPLQLADPDHVPDEPAIPCTDATSPEPHRTQMHLPVATPNEAPTASDTSAMTIAELLKLPTLAFLALLNWSTLLSTHIGWQWSTTQGLLCPRGLVVPLRGKPTLEDEFIRIRFRAAAGPCHNCERRHQCSLSKNPKFRKELSYQIPLNSLTQTQPSQTPPPDPPPPGTWSPPLPTATTSLEPVRGHRLVPSQLRAAHRRAAEALTIDVVVALPRETKLPAHLVSSDEERQHRRRSWEHRTRSQRLPTSASVRVDYQVASKDQSWIVSTA